MTSTAGWIASYRQAALRHGEASEAGNSRAANRAYDQLVRAARELRDAGPDAQRDLLPLLDDADPSVRTWAAVHLLALEPTAATAALHDVARGPRGAARISAEQVIAQWEDGSFEPPYR